VDAGKDAIYAKSIGYGEFTTLGGMAHFQFCGNALLSIAWFTIRSAVRIPYEQPRHLALSLSSDEGKAGDLLQGVITTSTPSPVVYCSDGALVSASSWHFKKSRTSSRSWASS